VAVGTTECVAVGPPQIVALPVSALRKVAGTSVKKKDPLGLSKVPETKR
jgi:hypothetical protein